MSVRSTHAHVNGWMIRVQARLYCVVYGKLSPGHLSYYPHLSLSSPFTTFCNTLHIATLPHCHTRFPPSPSCPLTPLLFLSRLLVAARGAQDDLRRRQARVPGAAGYAGMRRGTAPPQEHRRKQGGTRLRRLEDHEARQGAAQHQVAQAGGARGPLRVPPWEHPLPGTSTRLLSMLGYAC